MDLHPGYWRTRSKKIVILERKVIVGLENGETITLWEGRVKGETWGSWDIDGKNCGRYSVGKEEIFPAISTYDIINKVRGK